MTTIQQDTLHADKMNFTVTNIRRNLNAKEKNEIEAQLFAVFKKYAE